MVTKLDIEIQDRYTMTATEISSVSLPADNLMVRAIRMTAPIWPDKK